jgi:hypothetical protein
MPDQTRFVGSTFWMIAVVAVILVAVGIVASQYLPWVFPIVSWIFSEIVRLVKEASRLLGGHFLFDLTRKKSECIKRVYSRIIQWLKKLPKKSPPPPHSAEVESGEAARDPQIQKELVVAPVSHRSGDDDLLSA